MLTDPLAAFPHKQFRASHQELLVEAVGAIRDYAIFLLDPVGHVLSWNSGAELIHGYKESEIVGKHFSVFFTQEDLDRNHIQEELRIARQNGRFEEEGWRVRKDGSKFWANVIVTAFYDANKDIIGFVKVTRDLSEIRKSESVLRASEERFRQLVDGVKDYAIFLLDPKGIVATWNEGARRLKGYEADEIIGQHFSRFYPREDVEAGKCEMELKEATLTGRFEDESWRVRKDGTMFWASVVIAAVRDSRGKVTGFAKITRDLTERRRAEERLRSANEDLERKVKSRTQELVDAKDSLEKALHTRDEFLSIASHELKTPITSLRLQAQMLSSRVNARNGNSPPPELLARGLDLVLRQTDRLTALVETLLDVSHVHLGSFVIAPEPANLTDLVESVLSQWEVPLQAANCVLRRDIEPGLTGILDGLRLEQVLANLLSNVVKYAAGSEVRVSLRRESRCAVLKVEDSGPGIDPRKIDLLFHRFERLGAPIGVSGFGLGLYISKTIVEAHHGSISAESTPGKGTTFSIRFPLNVSRMHDVQC